MAAGMSALPRATVLLRQFSIDVWGDWWKRRAFVVTDFDTIREARRLAKESSISGWTVTEVDGVEYVMPEHIARLDERYRLLGEATLGALDQAEKALYEIVMAEPLEVDGRTMWPSFSGELQNKAAIALAVLRGKDTA